MEPASFILRRIAHTDNASLGVLTLRASARLRWRGFVLEDEPRAKKRRGETRIPSGRYRLGLRRRGGMHARYRRHFGEAFHKGMLELQDVPRFRHVLIHIGNTEAETAGCLLVNRRAAFTRDGELVGRESRLAYQRLYPLALEAMAHAPLWLTIENANARRLD